jgi:ABC-type lipoprotein export system ATPase subunit
MSKIKIKNFGPIKSGYQENDGWMEIRKVTALIGNQGSGKSSVAKLISTLSWLEKSMFRGEIEKAELTRKSKFQNIYCGYQGLKNYFKSNTEISFEGEYCNFYFTEGKFSIILKKGDYSSPKIMYVPAERNFVSAVAQPDKLKFLPKPLYTFLDEYERSKQLLTNNINLPIGDLEFSFDLKRNISKVVGKDHEVQLSEASSGLQSAIPLFIVSKNLSEGINEFEDVSISKLNLENQNKIRQHVIKILLNEKLTNEVKNSALEILSKLTKNAYFLNIVEEPEQNLFPSSQRNILNSLLEFNNQTENNKLIFTTHSPYIINYLTIAIQASYLNEKIINSVNNEGLKIKLNAIVPIKSLIAAKDVVIYQLEEKDGSIKKLPDFEGIPSDANYLNQSLAEGNKLFDALLEIEEVI